MFVLENSSPLCILRFRKVSTSLRCQLYIDSSGYNHTPSTTAYSVGQRVKMAFAYKANDFVLYINGNQASSYNGGTPSIGMYAIDFGTYYAAPDTFQYDGSIKSFALWKTRLTNTQLAQLTTI
jgi:hypothetical protein